MKRGLGTIITGVVLFVAGAFVVPAAIVIPLILNQTKAKQFLVPGSVEISAETPGRYYLWNDFRTVFNGRTYQSPEELPGGLEITITDGGGSRLTFVSDGSTSSSNGSSSKRSIGYVEVTTPGNLTVAVSGNTDQRVFSFARSEILKILGLVLGGMGASGLTALGGIILAIFGIVRLSRNSGPSLPRTPPAA
jgi:hypothetical protein